MAVVVLENVANGIDIGIKSLAVNIAAGKAVNFVISYGGLVAVISPDTGIVGRVGNTGIADHIVGYP